MIYVWEFEYYSEEEEEYTSCCYYTESDNRSVAIRFFQEDENTIEFSCVLDEVITEEQMMNQYGDLSMVLDKQV